MSDHTLFIYGTLQDAEVMQAVIGRTIPLTAQQEGIAPFFNYEGQTCPVSLLGRR